MDKNLMTIYMIVWEAYNNANFWKLLSFSLKGVSWFKKILVILLFLFLFAGLIVYLFYCWNRVNTTNKFLYAFILFFLFLISFYCLNKLIEDSFRKHNVFWEKYSFLERENRVRERYLLFSINLNKNNISREDIKRLLKSDMFAIEINRKEKSLSELLSKNIIATGSFTILITLLSGLSTVKEYWDTYLKFLLILTIIVLATSVYILVVIKYPKMSRKEKMDEIKRFLVLYMSEYYANTYENDAK